MAWLFPYVLFLHVMGAILAFGPTFAYSFIGGMGGKEPQHANFGARVTKRIGHGLVYPLAILQGVTGVILILIVGPEIASKPWLAVAILLYLFVLVYAFTIQRTALDRLIELSSTPPPAGPPPAGMPAGAPTGPPAGAPAGPPPELLATVKKVQRGGMMMGLSVVIIVFLMVVKPGA